VSGDGETMAVRGRQGRLWLSADAHDSYTGEVWTEAAGRAGARSLPAGGRRAPGTRLRCDPLGCIQHRGEDAVVALIRDQRALRADCSRASVVVSSEPIRGDRCRGPAVVVDRFDLWREGAHTIRFRDGVARIESVRGARGRRPWVRWPES